MGYVTHVWRSNTATSNGSTIAGTLGLTAGATLIDVGAVVATPSNSGSVPDTPSPTAKIVWIGPSNTESSNPTLTPTGVRAIATDVSTGEALWLTMTELQ